MDESFKLKDIEKLLGTGEEDGKYIKFSLKDGSYILFDTKIDDIEMRSKDDDLLPLERIHSTKALSKFLDQSGLL